MIRLDVLTPAELEIVRASIDAAANGPFFPDWEFQTLIGLERQEILDILDQWPPKTVTEEVQMAVVGSMNNLLGYPHGMDKELLKFVPSGFDSIISVLNRLLPESE